MPSSLKLDYGLSLRGKSSVICNTNKGLSPIFGLIVSTIHSAADQLWRNLADTQCQETQNTQSNFTPDAIPPQAFPSQSWKIYLLYREYPTFCVLKYMLYLEKQLEDLVQLKPRKPERKENILLY